MIKCRDCGELILDTLTKKKYKCNCTDNYIQHSVYKTKEYDYYIKLKNKI